MKKIFSIMLLCLLSQMLAGAAWAKRVALVIGNASYAEKPLKNAVNDAELMRSTLAELGFSVSFHKNLDQRALNRAITEFGRQIGGSEMVVVYYAGHGMQSGANNYLIPVDAQIKEPQDIESEGVAVRTILAKLEAAEVPANIVILDACRNNPYERARGSSRGLTRERTPVGTIVAYATEPGSTADDGDARNGVYTQYLAQFIKQPGLTVHKVFEKTALAVEKQTKGNQRPREENGLRGDYYFQLANLDLRPAPKPPTGGDLNLDDLERQANSREQETKQKAEWAAWQQKMQAGFDRASRLSGGADLQAKAWEQFLASFAADNPYSKEDESLRQQAQQKLASAQAELVQQRQTATPADRNLSSSSSASPKPGNVFRDCNDDSCPEMVWLPKGSFMMGSNESSDEQPIHQVSINYNLAVGKYPVTFAEWDACIASRGCEWTGDEGWGRGTRPVIGVSWKDAQDYAQWLSRKTGKNYRLLSEAEWEYAARAGSSTRYFWGDDIGNNNANCIGCGSQWDGKQTSPVGSFAPNGWGLYDMAGNAWNWVQDCISDNYSVAPNNGDAWNIRNCSKRVMRGGSWSTYPLSLRVANRGTFYATDRWGNKWIGFRVARTEN